MKFRCVIFTAALLLGFSGCSGLDYMIEEYNSRFGIHDDELDAEGNKIIDEQGMLEKTYTIGKDQSLSIPAPKIEGAKYAWKVLDKSADLDKGGGEAKQVQEGQVFILKFGSDLGVGDYTLTLTVTAGDTTYTDEAVLTVHEE